MANDDWDLAAFHKGLQEQGNRRQAAIADLTAQLGVPGYFVKSPYDDSPKSGIGYWRANGGIISYQFTPNGQVIPESRGEMTEEHVAKLYALLGK